MDDICVCVENTAAKHLLLKFTVCTFTFNVCNYVAFIVFELLLFEPFFFNFFIGSLRSHESQFHLERAYLNTLFILFAYFLVHPV